ncbi:hypothetical protein [Kitasatospora sp. NPDC088346]|uniref:hypothetical protein n=1 Tax=Kitasatospora sp. NPDC088346 TaxID=3364073 RepID=UPI0038252262
MTESWWGNRRDALLGQVSAELRSLGADAVDDPGAAELAAQAAGLAARAPLDGRSPEAARLLTGAAAELERADRFRGTFLPQVLRHLRGAYGLLVQADRGPDAPGGPGGSGGPDASGGPGGQRPAGGSGA